MKAFVFAILLSELMATLLLCFSTIRSHEKEIWFQMLHQVSTARIECVTGLPFNEAMRSKGWDLSVDPVYRRAEHLAMRASQLKFWSECLERSGEFLIPAPFIAIAAVPLLRRFKQSSTWRTCKRFWYECKSDDPATYRKIAPESCSIYLWAVGSLLAPFFGMIALIMCSLRWR